MAHRNRLKKIKVAAVILTVVLGAGVVGVTVLIRSLSEQTETAGDEAAGGGAAWTEPSEPNLTLGAPVKLTPEARVAALKRRAITRSFDGAPPVIPHPIKIRRTNETCLACHEDGIEVEGRPVQLMSHRPLGNCTQCHVSTRPALTLTAMSGENSFSGVASPGPGARAWPGDPPRIPHGTWMRRECGACHGVIGLPGLRTTHPERRSCTQCHAMSAGAQPW